MHISKLELKNFKRFSQLDIDLSSRITVLLGPNSSGKSSILKAILALKQTASQTNENEALATQGEYVDLGVYRDYVFEHKVDSRVEIAPTFSGIPSTAGLGVDDSGRTRLSLSLGHDHSTEQARLLEIKFCSPDSNDELISITKKITRDTFQLRIPAPSVPRFLRRQDPGPALIKAWAAGVSVRVDDRYAIVPERVSDGEQKFSMERDFPVFVARNCVEYVLRSLDSDFFYIGPLRRSPSRSYARTGHLLSVGAAGEHTPSVLANLEARAAKERSAQAIHKGRISQFHDWMQALFPGRQVEARRVDELVKLLLHRSEAKGEVISDVGFGISQILPILVQIAVMPDDSTLLIEQPELHLHPSIQTKLADVVAAASKSGRRFIVETHSEHFVRGLQLAVSNERARRRGKTKLNRSDVRFLYVPSAPADPMDMEMNEWGEFTQEWPKGFFDEAYRLAMQLLENKMRAMQDKSGVGASEE